MSAEPSCAPRRAPAAWVQLGDLFLMEMTNWRWSWRAMLITGTVAPLFSMVALGLFASSSGAETLGYILTGNMVLSLMFENLNRMESRFGFMRTTGTFDYYASLPIRRECLILATVFSFLLLSLPALAVTLGAGALFLRLPLHLHPALVLAVPLCAVPLAGIGALIGVMTRNPQEGGSLSLLVTLVLVALGPVVVPPARLPAAIRLAGWLSPATYAASALRQTVLGPVTPRLLLDLGVLAGVAALVLWVVGRRMAWREA